MPLETSRNTWTSGHIRHFAKYMYKVRQTGMRIFKDVCAESAHIYAVLVGDDALVISACC